MRRLLKRRKLVAGIVGVLMIGGVALAVVLGQARVNNNEVFTGDVTAPPVLSVGIITDTMAVTSCADMSVTYEVVSSSQLISNQEITLSTGAITLITDAILCVRNDNTQDLNVFASTENVVSGELMGCPDANEAAVGDTTCDPATGGELAGGELDISYTAQGSWSNPGATGYHCSSAGPVPLIDGATTDQMSPMATIGSGGYCGWTVTLSADTVITDFRASSTDTLVFDIVFNGDNGT